MRDLIKAVRTYVDLVFDRCRPADSPSRLLADGIDLVTGNNSERIATTRLRHGITVERCIPALAGLAPVARDSGQIRGKRMIRGGRPAVRTMLYIAALHASRFCAPFRTFRHRLTDAGKPMKVVLTATAHKLSRRSER